MFGVFGRVGWTQKGTNFGLTQKLEDNSRRPLALSTDDEDYMDKDAEDIIIGWADIRGLSTWNPEEKQKK